MNNFSDVVFVFWVGDKYNFWVFIIMGLMLNFYFVLGRHELGLDCRHELSLDCRQGSRGSRA